MADSNSILLPFSKIIPSIDFNKIETGEPLSCDDCRSKLSKLCIVDSKSNTWMCDFCGCKNSFDDVEQIPKEVATTYMIEKPTKVVEKESSSPLIIFAIDTSGSMGVTSEFKQGIILHPKLQNGKVLKHISRLECLAAAIANQLETISKQSPNSKVVIVEFSNDVTAVSGRKKEKITGRILDSQSELIRKGKEFFSKTVPIGETLNETEKFLFDMSPNGCTSLGPALAFSVGIASGVKGSKIILCTDGLANNGIGSLASNGKNFYPQIANVAKENGTSISILTIDGEDCKMEDVGKCADITSGSVEIIDPLEMKSKIVKLMNNSILATNVKVVLRTNRYIVFSNQAKNVSNKIEIEIGNVTSETDMAFSFEVVQHKLDDLLNCIFDKPKENEDQDLINLLKYGVPFQLEMHYTANNGGKYQTILSDKIVMDGNRTNVEENLNSACICLSTIQSSARLAEIGEYDNARINLFSTQRLLQRGMKTPKNQDDYISFIIQSEQLDQFIREAQNQIDIGLVNKNANKAELRDDQSSKAMYQMKSLSLNKFFSSQSLMQSN